jgi:S-DNA-T family DNA segregation ATPase FtsK/SpoIIIE
LAPVRAFGLVRRWLVPVELPRAVVREGVALLVLAVALLIAGALLGLGSSYGAIGWGTSAVRQLFGRGAFLVPLCGIWLAGELVFSRQPAASRRRGLGLALYISAVLVFLDLRGGAEITDAGGYLGAGISGILQLIGGQIGAGLLAVALGCAGLGLATGAELLAVPSRWRALQQARRSRSAGESAPPVSPPRRPARDGDGVAAIQTPEFQPVIALAPAKTKGEGARRGERRRLAVEAAKADASARQTTEPVSEAITPAPLPELGHLKLYQSGAPDPTELHRKAAVIQETLASFRVEARVREVYPGPAVTLFTLEPGPGVKVRRITELQNDLALALAAKAIRIEAPVPGMARVGIEVPNETISTVGLRETIESAAFQRSRAVLPLALGRDVNGQYVVADLTKMPHLLIAGATGSGKSVCINSIIATFLLTRRPEELQMLLIDPKMVELAGYDGVPHLKRPVVTDVGLVVGALRRLLQEMERRYQLFSKLGVRNLDGYRLRRDEDPSLESLPYLVVVIDELADLMLTTPDEVETLLVRLAQMARATGIHLLIATQRPSVDVLTGLIKANIPARIAFAVTSQTDSRVILDMPGAERLLGRGDMLFLPPDAARPQRIQGSFIDDRDLQYLVEHWRTVMPNPQYDPSWIELDQGEGGDDPGDPLLEQARQLVRQHGTASTSMLQRRLRIGYNRAARLMERLEAEGIVGPLDGSRGRLVYIAEDD